MNHSFFKFSSFSISSISFLSIILITTFVSTFFIIFITEDDISTASLSPISYVRISYSDSSLDWPIPGYKRISSSFGKRVAPTTGASTNHSGIDIPAPPRNKSNCHL